MLLLSYSPVNVPATPTEQQRRVYTRPKGPVKGGREGKRRRMKGSEVGCIHCDRSVARHPMVERPSGPARCRTRWQRSGKFHQPASAHAEHRHSDADMAVSDRAECEVGRVEAGSSLPRQPFGEGPHPVRWLHLLLNRSVRKCEVFQVQAGYTLSEFDSSRRHQCCRARWGSEAVQPGRSGTPRRRFGDRRSPGRKPSRHDLPSRRVVIFPSIPSSSRRHHDQLLEGLSMIRIRTL